MLTFQWKKKPLLTRVGGEEVGRAEKPLPVIGTKTIQLARSCREKDRLKKIWEAYNRAKIRTLMNFSIYDFLIVFTPALVTALHF